MLYKIFTEINMVGRRYADFSCIAHEEAIKMLPISNRFKVRAHFQHLRLKARAASQVRLLRFLPSSFLSRSFTGT